MRLDHTVDDLCRRHLTDTHQEELYQTDMYTTHGSVDPQHEGHIVEEDDQADTDQHNQNDIANLNDNEQKIIDAIKQTGAITRKEVEELLNLGKTSAFKYLSILCVDILPLLKQGDSYRPI